MRRTTQAGFTLIELMVSIVVTLFIFAAVMAAFITVQGAYHREARAKAVIEGSRGASSYIERLVRYAGYGLPPTWTLDFAFPTDNAAVGATGAVTDDFAFRYRDPYYRRHGTVNGGTLQLIPSPTASPTDPPPNFGVGLSREQAVLVACPAGTQMALYRLNAAVDSDDDQVAVSEVAGMGNPAAPCLASINPPPFVMIVHEKRLRVIEQGGRPWLVVFHDHQNPAGNTNFDPIAADVESFQVAYVMNRPQATSECCAGATLDTAGGNWIFGDQAGDGLPNPNAEAPEFETDYDDPRRYSAHPANVRSVRLSLTARTTLQDPIRKMSSTPVALENHVPANLQMDGFYRTTTTTAVRLGNQTSRAFFTPPTGTLQTFNFNGG
jgi:type IV pilus assembly protein PilW